MPTISRLCSVMRIPRAASSFMSEDRVTVVSVPDLPNRESVATMAVEIIVT
jgi:hypothetical protein